MADKGTEPTKDFSFKKNHLQIEQEGEGWQIVLFQKISTPFHGRFFKLNPPIPRNFHFSVILSLKKLGLGNPPPLLTFLGVGMYFFWTTKCSSLCCNMFRIHWLENGFFGRTKFIHAQHINIIYYMASSGSGQDEPNCTLWVRYPSGQDDSIYPLYPPRKISPKAI